eukprot:TCONS_00051965-protein
MSFGEQPIACITCISNHHLHYLRGRTRTGLYQGLVPVLAFNHQISNSKEESSIETDPSLCEETSSDKRFMCHSQWRSKVNWQNNHSVNIYKTWLVLAGLSCVSP